MACKCPSHKSGCNFKRYLNQAVVAHAFNLSTLEAEKVDLCESEVSLVYRASSRTARATQRNAVSKQTKNQNQKPNSPPQNTEIGNRSWRDSSVVKSTDCFSRGPGFNSQHLQDVQLPVTIIPGDKTSSSGLYREQGMVHRHMCRQNTQTQTNQNMTSKGMPVVYI